METNNKSLKTSLQIKTTPLQVNGELKQTELNWHANFESYFSFLERENHPPSCKKNSPDEEQKLARWAKSQRRGKITGKLSNEKIKKLTARNFKWQPVPVSDIWEKNFAKCSEFIKQYGHEPSQISQNPDEDYIGRWLSRQKHAQVNNKLDAELEAKLTAIGIRWTSIPHSWPNVLAEYLKFMQEHGKEPKKYGSLVDEERLAQWAYDQRKAASKGKLSIDKVNLLKEINFNVAPKKNQVWEQKLSEYTKFLKQNKRQPSDKGGKLERSLAKWAKYQRNAKEKNINPEYLLKLENIGFEWQVYTALWNRTYSEYCEFIIQHGMAPYSKVKSEKEKKLVDWATYQRQTKNNGTLKEERLALLNAISFDFREK